MREIEGTWPVDDLRRAFVAGVKWWILRRTGEKIWPHALLIAKNEAEWRYPGGKVRQTPSQTNQNGQEGAKVEEKVAEQGPCCFCGKLGHWGPECPKVEEIIKLEQKQRKRVILD